MIVQEGCYQPMPTYVILELARAITGISLRHRNRLSRQSLCAIERFIQAFINRHGNRHYLVLASVGRGEIEVALLRIIHGSGRGKR